MIGGRPKVAPTLHHILNKIRQAYAEANAAFFHIVFYLYAALRKLDYPFYKCKSKAVALCCTGAVALIELIKYLRLYVRGYRRTVVPYLRGKASRLSFRPPG